MKVKEDSEKAPGGSRNTKTDNGDDFVPGSYHSSIAGQPQVVSDGHTGLCRARRQNWF